MPFRTTYSICIRCEVLTRRSDHRCRKPGAENRKDLQRIANRHNAYRSMMSLVRDQDLFAFVRRKRNQKKLRKCCQNTAKLAVLLVGTHVVSGSRSRTDLLEPKCPAYTDKDNAVLQYLVESDSEETDAGSSRIDSSSSSSSSDDDDDDDSSTDLSDEEFPADRRSEDDTDSIASSSLNQTPDHVCN